MLADLLHHPVGFEEDADDALVVVEVLAREYPALAVFEPFLGESAAADVEVPGGLDPKLFEK